MSSHSENKAKDYRTIFIVFVVLGILTLVEYFVSITIDSPVLLMIIAFAKAGFVVNFFMHVYRLWREDAH